MEPGEPGLLGMVPAVSPALNSARKVRPPCFIFSIRLLRLRCDSKGLSTEVAFGEFAVSAVTMASLFMVQFSEVVCEPMFVQSKMTERG